MCERIGCNGLPVANLCYDCTNGMLSGRDDEVESLNEQRENVVWHFTYRG